jgi:hypothetical protein
MDQEQTSLELGRQIWHLRKAGYDRIQILEELEISVQQLEDSLTEFESQLGLDAGRAMEHFRQLDNERIEEVLECWMPIALGDGRPADEMSDDDFDLQLRASYGVLAAIDQRHKIMLASQPQKTSTREESVNVLAFLQQFHGTQNGDGNGSDAEKLQ